MDEKEQFVLQWLRTRFDDIPPFERTENSINILFQLAHNNIQQNDVYSELMQDHRRRIREYQLMSQRNKNILKQTKLFHIPSANASSSLNASTSSGSFNSSVLNTSSSVLGNTSSTTTRPIVRALAETAVTLDINDLKNSSYLLAINDLTQENDKVVDQHLSISNTALQLSKKNLLAVKKLNELKKLLDGFKKEQEKRASDDTVEKRREHIEYLKKKAEDYEQQIGPLRGEIEKMLSAAQIDSLGEIQHTTIVKMYQDVIELKSKVEPKLQKLASYHNLPPDENGVKVSIIQAESELRSLEDKFKYKAQEMWAE
ncbi:HAUS augmin-like complex subunit 1 [Acrasis kona]|uniref:HAUS augmin-like complex subunit 1 n=1 Tax=Acrasis kona TaxID=1008807 RepID=A0AAW2YXI9_9EUKA